MMAGTRNKPDLTGLKVLLVDDHRDSADSMAWLLQSFGCEAQARFDGASALACVEALEPDVVFLDIRLPDMPGTEVCRRMRSLSALGATTLVALTGATDDRTLVSVEEAGFDRTLTKPVELDDILEVLCSAASTKGQRNRR
jgi:CheY-like chemotaxis protein